MTPEGEKLFCKLIVDALGRKIGKRLLTPHVEAKMKEIREWLACNRKLPEGGERKVA